MERILEGLVSKPWKNPDRGFAMSYLQQINNKFDPT